MSGRQELAPAVPRAVQPIDPARKKTMIPTTADEATLNRYVANIVSTYEAATDDQLARGRAWYRTAHQVAILMAEGDDEATDEERAIRGAGVIAALSPQKAWYLNKRIAEESFRTGEAQGNVGNAVRKAEQIMLGANPLDVLPADSKTWNFYRCIVDPEDEEAVVIDRHAHDVAVGEVYGSRDRRINKSRYAVLALAYRLAAYQLGILPQTLQAVTWVVQVEAVAHLPHRPSK